MVMGDFNSQVMADNSSMESTIGEHGLGRNRERESLLGLRNKRGADIASDHYLVIASHG